MPRDVRLKPRRLTAWVGNPAACGGLKPDSVKAEAFYPDWLNKLLTTKVNGLENYEEMLRHLESKDAIKVFVQVAPDEASDAAGD